jgi:hypothetical protein
MFCTVNVLNLFIYVMESVSVLTLAVPSHYSSFEWQRASGHHIQSSFSPQSQRIIHEVSIQTFSRSDKICTWKFKKLLHANHEVNNKVTNLKHMPFFTCFIAFCVDACVLAVLSTCISFTGALNYVALLAFCASHFLGGIQWHTWHHPVLHHASNCCFISHC